MHELRFSEEHQWVHNDHGVATVGISEFAQSELGDIVHVELPEEGSEVEAGEQIATVESVKTASDIFAPISGTIVTVNRELADAPESINEDPESSAWFVKIEMSEPGELDSLMSLDEYMDFVGDDD
ncbi:glycine cleavage system protein GcvH [Litorivicinus lipolyticus]|uniref:Glycine cleavage system H protein n=1 Tax=Litorivicinus lipolyticus TaxID=418701 RepID=A0A5Q2QI63_9GAMM|nr:glycine cleavage system protein GcvH [Litorivicinus lipolyticus]QGG80725.1 glycine cleavage system protein GcvH [Litorivicinus lipolyticus]